MTFRYALVLVGFCTVGYFGVVAYLLATSHGMLWQPDGTALYYTFFAYEGEALRSALGSLASGSFPEISAYTLSEGYGADVITTLGGNLVNPLNLLAVFFPSETAEYGYYLTAWMRVVLAGLAFSLYCFNRGKGYRQALVGSLCYTFCGFMVFWGMIRHAGFMNVGVLLPVLLMGADKVFERDNPGWFVGTVALCFFLSVYYTYILCLCLLGYCLVKYFFVPRERSAGDLALLVSRFVVLLAIGFAIGAVSAMPNIMALSGMGRVDQATTVPLFHALTYYLSAITTMVGTYISTRGLFLGAATLVCVAVFLLCGKRFDADERKPWLIGLVVVVVMACVPWFGHAFNGFGYVTDRWMILVGFVVSYIACLAVPVFPKLEAREWKVVGCSVGAVLALAAVATFFEAGLPLAATTLVPAGILFVAVWAGVRKLVAMPYLMAFLVVLGAGSAAAVHLSPIGDSYAVEFADLGSAYSTVYEESPSAAMSGVAGGEDVRYSVPSVSTAQANHGLANGQMGLSVYSSTYSQPVDDLRDDLGIWGNHKNYLYGGNDSRLAIDALVGAKYFVARGSQAWRVPSSYEPVGEAAGYGVYKTDYALPLVFSSGSTVAQADYAGLSMAGKQEALLQGVVLDDEEAGQGAVKPDVASTTPELSIVPDANVFVEDGSIVVAEDDAGVTLSFEGAPRAETYLCLEGLGFDGLSKADAARLRGEQPDESLRSRIREELLYRTPSMFTFTVSQGERWQSVNVSTPTATTYVSRHKWAVNMGYADDAVSELRLTFAKAGVYSYDSLEVLCQPVRPLLENLRALQRGGASEVVWEGDSITASFDDLDPGSYVVFTVPYSKGWSATIDGKPAEILRADVAFMSLRIDEAGPHEVEFRYVTPGLVPGAFCSVAGIIALVVLCLARRSSRRKARSGAHASIE